MPQTAERLGALAAHLGEPPSQVAATLHSELARALREIDAGLAAADRERVGRATHAARNSVLMLDDRPMLAALRALDHAAGRDADVAAARQRVQLLWQALSVELAAV